MLISTTGGVSGPTSVFFTVNYAGIIRALLILNLFVSLLALLLYGVDKGRAVRHRWRIPESVLISSAFFGGAAGALAGMLLFHHKTKKWKFRILVPLALLLWAVVFILLAGKSQGRL